MKKLLLYLTFCFLAQSALATSIVILVTSQYILIGSDSKRLLLDAQAKVTEEKNVCKIQSAGSYCFAMAGFTMASATSFSADQIIARNLKNAPSYNKAILNIKTEIRKALEKELRHQQTHCPASFRQLTASKEPLLEIVVLSARQGSPQMELIGFQLDKNNRIQVGSYTSRCPGDCPQQQQQFYFMGSYQTMERYLGTQRGVRDPVGLVENLILEQSKATPSSVGAPVHLAKYTAKGIEWIK